MKYTRCLVLIIAAALFGVGFPQDAHPAAAQGGQDACPSLVQQALALADEACSGLTRNTACYGYTQVVATGWDAAALPNFASPGDTADLTRLASLATAPLDTATNQWGVAVLSLRADLPEMLPGQNVTFVLFGDAHLRSDVPPEAMAAPPPTCTAQVERAVNVRGGPGMQYPALGTAIGGENVTVTGRNQAGDWLRISFQGRNGWVYAPLLTLNCPLATLRAVTAEDANAYTAPMQAFYLTTGVGEPACAEAPRDGLLVQSPEGVTVHFRVNGVEIALSSTVFMRAEDENHLVIGVLDGHVDVISAGERTTLEVGYRLALSADAPPGQPEPWSNAVIRALPVRLLPHRITVPLIVPGTAAWVDSGVSVSAGQRFTLRAAGLVHPCTNLALPNCTFYGPVGGAGIASAVDPDPENVARYPLPNAQIPALVGRIGEGAPFLVGAGGAFTAEANGVLKFQVNDSPLDNNAGAFIVVITVVE